MYQFTFTDFVQQIFELFIELELVRRGKDGHIIHFWEVPQNYVLYLVISAVKVACFAIMKKITNCCSGKLGNREIRKTFKGHLVLTPLYPIKLLSVKNSKVTCATRCETRSKIVHFQRFFKKIVQVNR